MRGEDHVHAEAHVLHTVATLCFTSNCTHAREAGIATGFSMIGIWAHKE